MIKYKGDNHIVLRTPNVIFFLGEGNPFSKIGAWQITHRSKVTFSPTSHTLLKQRQQYCCVNLVLLFGCCQLRDYIVINQLHSLSQRAQAQEGETEKVFQMLCPDFLLSHQVVDGRLIKRGLHETICLLCDSEKHTSTMSRKVKPHLHINFFCPDEILVIAVVDIS